MTVHPALKEPARLQESPRGIWQSFRHAFALQKRSGTNAPEYGA